MPQQSPVPSQWPGSSTHTCWVGTLCFPTPHVGTGWSPPARWRWCGAPGWLLAGDRQIRAQSILQSRRRLPEMRCQAVKWSGSPHAITAGLEAGGRAARLPGAPELGAGTVLCLWQHDPPVSGAAEVRCHGWAELAVSCPCRAFWVGRSSRAPGGGGEGGPELSCGLLWHSFRSTAGGGKQPACRGGRRVPPQVPACPAVRHFLLDHGCRRLEVTLRDGVLLRPSGMRQALPLGDSNPMRLRGWPTPNPTALGTWLAFRDLLLGVLQLGWCYPKPATSMHLFR